MAHPDSPASPVSSIRITHPIRSGDPASAARPAILARVVVGMFSALGGLSGCVATAPTAPGASTGAGVTPTPPSTPLPTMLARLPKATVPTAGTPAARLSVRATLVNNQQQAGLVQLVDQIKCQQPHLVGLAPRSASANPSGGTSGSTGSATPEAPLAFTAGQPVTLDGLVTDGSRAVWAVRWSFTPQANRHYLVQGVSLGSVCSAALTDVTQPDRPRTPEDLRYRSDPGKPCVPLEQSRRVPPGMLEGGQVNGEAVLRPLATENDLKGLIKP